MTNKWDERFMAMAQLTASWSPDPSTKIGAVIVNNKNIVVSQGWNGFPRGVADLADRYADRYEKYTYTVHAEQNAIYNACWNGVCLADCTIYVYGLPTCHDCAKGIVQTGIKRVVMAKLRDDPKWEESFKYSANMYIEAGVRYEFMELK